jgi:peptidyl-prolyl cis-trans isomerase D
LGLLQRTIEQMVNRSLLNQAAADLGLGADDETLRRMIAETPAFQNQLKVFDKDVYQRTLMRAGLTERQFLAMERSDVAREQLTQTVAGGLQAPDALVLPLFRYRQENRTAEVVTFLASAMPQPPKPSDEQLSQFHQAHSQQFMSPELRGLTALVVRTSDVAADIKIPESDIERSYQIRQAEFVTPETRSIQQVSFADQDKAKAFAEAAKSQDFATAAKAAGVEPTDLGKVDRKGVPLPELADAAFALPSPGVTAPVQSPLGWHVLRVNAIQAGTGRSLADVREQIIRDLTKDEATNRLYALSTKMEDALGSGASLEEAASSLGLKLIKVPAVDDHGNDTAGKPIADLVAMPAVLAKAFEQDKGTTSEVTSLDNNAGYYVVRVDSIAAPAVTPLASIRDKVAAAWVQEQREQAARHQADTALERLRKGEPIGTVAGSLKVETTPPFPRSSDGKPTVPPLLAAEMFKQSAIGDAAVVTVPGGSMVARLASILPADPKTQQKQLSTIRDQVLQSMGDDLMRQYVAMLFKTHGVSINNAAIDAQFPK